MMIEPLTFDNLTYISIRDAAAGSHLSTEYLTRLGHIRGRMVAHMWFIEMHSLQQFLVTRFSKSAIVTTASTTEVTSPASYACVDKFNLWGESPTLVRIEPSTLGIAL